MWPTPGKRNYLEHEMSDEIKPVDLLSYEQAMDEMEAIIQQMEGEQLALEQALTLFERGQALAKHCADLLSQAELKVRQLTGQEIADLRQQQQQDDEQS
jgi:exodeoxyribonuclease VII small subunit